ncbi:general transcription factor 3C polypeptide 5 [Zophobas morio]|uniref:general transcription factor 3C polypeptide 5 n=1 Tax=Zophobas morio TaxID=2755281 RepID=UPI00308339A5
MEVDTESPSTSFVKDNSRNQTKLPKLHFNKEDKNTGNWFAKNKKKAENELDPKHIVQINKHLVRVEYPGEVKNVDRAIETLGGIHDIEESVAEHGRKLQLNFHNRNKYNKGCFGEKDFKPGILIKVKKPAPVEAQSDNASQENIKYEYDIEGVSVINFTFNRLCDFQYLPLVAKYPETKSSTTENIYEKILPSHLPNIDWLETDGAKNMDQFLLPVNFSHHDSAQTKQHVDNSDKNEPKLNLKGGTNPVKLNPKQQKNVCRIFRKARQQISIFVAFKDKEIPTKPLESAVRMLKHRNLENGVSKIKQLFEERPIWTKAAIRHITGLTDEHSRIILPIVAYYFTNGPWRITWVKYGYDPRKDPKARIYQTLDYRIRTAESSKLKVSAKRSYASKTSIFLAPNQTKKVSLKYDMSARPKMELDERYYVLRPLTLPPARQMFYQFCDLLIPEIQDMISRLPESSGGFCHAKNGFLPDNFIEHCRRIVNDHVLEAVQKELLEDKKILQEKVSKETESKDSGSHLDYYNQMLSNIKKGIYRNVGFQYSKIPREIDPEQDIELISLSSDEENDEYTVGEIIQSSMPERLDVAEEEEEQQSDVSESSDEAEIDMDAVQEINEMISHLGDKLY